MRRPLRKRALILILLAIGIFQNSYGQFAFNNVPFKPKNPPAFPYKIIQSRDGDTTKVEEFNENGQLVFQYIQGDIPPFFDWSKPHIFIYAFEFDETGNKVKRYAFNSNAGHNIYQYEFNKELNTKTTYVRSFPENEEDKNTNAYANIARIKSFRELKASSEVSTIMSSERDLLSVEYLNEKGKTTRIKDYNNIYTDSINTFIAYDNESRKISRRVVMPSGELKKEVLNEYPDENTEITRINNYRNEKKISSYQIAEVKNESKQTKTQYSERNNKLNIRHYQYENEYLTKIVVYKTKFKNRLIVPISINFKKVAEMNYYYNKRGLLEKEEMENYETGKAETRTYQYQIEKL